MRARTSRNPVEEAPLEEEAPREIVRQCVNVCCAYLGPMRRIVVKSLTGIFYYPVFSGDRGFDGAVIDGGERTG